MSILDRLDFRGAASVAPLAVSIPAALAALALACVALGGAPVRATTVAPGGGQGHPAARAAPSASAAGPAASTPLDAAQQRLAERRAKARAEALRPKVDINNAGKKELMTLPGVGAAEADAIIAHRPYLSKTELVSKQVLPLGPYISLKNRIVAMQPLKPKRKP